MTEPLTDAELAQRVAEIVKLSRATTGLDGETTVLPFDPCNDGRDLLRVWNWIIARGWFPFINRYQAGIGSTEEAGVRSRGKMIGSADNTNPGRALCLALVAAVEGKEGE